jgi:phosphohistidine phosphatase
VRHAQAVNGLQQSDAERSLTPTGEQQAIQLGKFLKSKSILPKIIISSPAIRAHATAVQIATQLGIDPITIQLKKSIYSDSKIEILKLITDIDFRANEVLVVGHFPTIVELYNYLTSTEAIAAMDTAEIRSLTFELPWSEITENSGTPIQDL